MQDQSNSFPVIPKARPLHRGRIVGKRGLARVFGVSLTTVWKWVRNGLPHAPRSVTDKPCNFDTRTVVDWHIKQKWPPSDYLHNTTVGTANRCELAEIFAVSLPTIDNWVRHGLPYIQRAEHGKPYIFSVIQTIAWKLGRQLSLCSIEPRGRLITSVTIPSNLSESTVNKAELSSIFGVSIPAIDNWLLRGLPVARDPADCRAYQFDLQAVTTWINECNQKKILFREQNSKPPKEKKPIPAPKLCEQEGCGLKQWRNDRFCRVHFFVCSIPGCEQSPRSEFPNAANSYRWRDGKLYCREHLPAIERKRPEPPLERVCSVEGCVEPCVAYTHKDRQGKPYAAVAYKCAEHRRQVRRDYNANLPAKAKGKIKQTQRNRYWKDPEKARQKASIYRHANPDKIKFWKQLRQQRMTQTADGSVTEDFLYRLWNESLCCPYCEDPYKLSNKSFDHQTPLARGGKHVAENMIVCCSSCNSGKRDKTEGEWRAYLQAHPERADRRAQKASCRPAHTYLHPVTFEPILVKPKRKSKKKIIKPASRWF